MKHAIRSLFALLFLLSLALSAVSCTMERGSGAARHRCSGEPEFEQIGEDPGTCQRRGYVEYRCLTCQSFTYKVYNNKMGEHSFGSTYIVIEEPDYGKEGKKARRCTRAGCDAYTDVQIIPAKETVTDPITT